MTVTEFNPALRHRIAMAIMESGLTQKEVAARMHLSPQVVSRWVRGHRVPSALEVVELAEVTGAPWLADLRSIVPSGTADLGERRSTCTPVSAGQRVFSYAA